MGFRHSSIVAFAVLQVFSATSAHAVNWITDLRDDVAVTKLSIPGTHDAGTGNGFNGLSALVGSSTALTQDLSLADQWDAGIRAFDLRPAVKKNDSDYKLQIFHGILETKLGFKEALLTLSKKLKDAPGEFAIVVMRHENDGDKNIGDRWSALMAECLGSEELSDVLIDFKPDLTIGEMRGKILILSRDHYDNGPCGGYVSSWSHDPLLEHQTKTTITGHNGQVALAAVQDYYDTTSAEALQNKLTAIKRMLEFSSTSPGNIWVINHTSGYTKNASSNGYRDNATKTNPLVVDWLSDPLNEGPTGIVMMDYAGVDDSKNYNVAGKRLIDALIEHNNKYQKSGMGDVSIDKSYELTIDGLKVKGNGLIEAYVLDGRMVNQGWNEMYLPSERGLYLVSCAGVTKKYILR